MKNSQIFLDLGPLIAFFATYRLTDNNIYIATMVIMVATAIALLISWLQTRRIRPMPLVTLVLIVVFGGLTLYFKNPDFIKMKPTIIYLLFASALGGGALVGSWFLKAVFAGAFEMPDDVWAKLTWRWAGFFVFLAGLNEFVWRSFDESTWVNIKVFGFLPLTLLFAMANLPLMLKYMKQDEAEDSK
ncbi:MAG: septation protein A [Robiginitomaculum sp.]|nr:MAG: septation protein A [Robiginitomaculum sp.]